MDGEDRFGEELSARLAAVRVGEGLVPLVEIRGEGRRRVRRRRRWQAGVVALAAVGGLSVGLGLPGGVGDVPSALPAASASGSGLVQLPVHCSGATTTPVLSATPWPSGVWRDPRGKPHDPRLESAADTADRLGRGQFADTYAGVCLDPLGQKMYVYRLAGSGLDTALRAAEPGVDLVFLDAKYPRRRLDELAQQIRSDPYWASQGVVISDVSVQSDGSGLAVVTPQAARVAKDLEDRYWPYVADVSAVGPVDLG